MAKGRDTEESKQVASNGVKYENIASRYSRLWKDGAGVCEMVFPKSAN